MELELSGLTSLLWATYPMNQQSIFISNTEAAILSTLNWIPPPQLWKAQLVKWKTDILGSRAKLCTKAFPSLLQRVRSLHSKVNLNLVICASGVNSGLSCLMIHWFVFLVLQGLLRSLTQVQRHQHTLPILLLQSSDFCLHRVSWGIPWLANTYNNNNEWEANTSVFHLLVSPLQWWNYLCVYEKLFNQLWHF